MLILNKALLIIILNDGLLRITKKIKKIDYTSLVGFNRILGCILFLIRVGRIGAYF